MEVRLHNLVTYDRLRDHVLQRGCYSPAENERIYQKWFASAPRYRFRAVNRKYGLTRGVLCDVGCAYGSNLVFCSPESYGIEIEPYEVNFARSIGLTVYQMDVIQADFTGLPRVDAIWNSATLEHVTAPHIFLRKLHQLLKPDGLLAIYVPTLPPLAWLRGLPRIGRYVSAYRHDDHINAFTPAVLRFLCERAGFRTLEVSPFYPGALAALNPLHLLDGCIYVGRKLDPWDYPPLATRRAADNPSGFAYVGQKFAE